MSSDEDFKVGRRGGCGPAVEEKVLSDEEKKAEMRRLLISGRASAIQNNHNVAQAQER